MNRIGPREASRTTSTARRRITAARGSSSQEKEVEEAAGAARRIRKVRDPRWMTRWRRVGPGFWRRPTMMSKRKSRHLSAHPPRHAS
eukprot:9279320-Pyramimonas_sp.AAC.1